ncbi:MAG: hypothetical protein ACTSWQ_07465, partial [Candidatus Thorarchaeota archaeon]
LGTELNNFSQTIVLVEGENEITIIAEDATAKSESNALVVIKDTKNPGIVASVIIEGSALPEEGVTAESMVDLEISYLEEYPAVVHVSHNGNALPDQFVEPSNRFTEILVEDIVLEAGSIGQNTFVVEIEDLAGNHNASSSVVYLDTRQPDITITAVTADGLVVSREDIYKTNSEEIIIWGTYTEEHIEAIVVEGGRTEAEINYEDASFKIVVDLNGKTKAETENNITLLAIDKAGLVGEARVTIVQDQLAPVPMITAPSTDGSKYFTQTDRPTIEMETNEWGKCSITYVPKDFSGHNTLNFSSSHGITHTVEINIPLENTLNKNEETKMTIACEDEFGNYLPTTDIKMVVDSTEPHIEEYGLTQGIQNTAITEYKDYLLVKTPHSEFIVNDANEPVVCRYGTTQTWEDMAPLGSLDDFQMSQVSDTVEFVDQQTVTYYILCRDRALRLAPEVGRVDVTVNLSNDVWIVDRGPLDFATAPEDQIWVMTFREAECSVDIAMKDGDDLNLWQDFFDPPVTMPTTITGPTNMVDCGHIFGEVNVDEVHTCLGNALLDGCKPARFTTTELDGEVEAAAYDFVVYGMEANRCVSSVHITFWPNDQTHASEGDWTQCPIDLDVMQQEFEMTYGNPAANPREFGNQYRSQVIHDSMMEDDEIECFGPLDRNTPSDLDYPPGISSGTTNVYYHTLAVKELIPYSEYAYDVICEDPNDVFQDANTDISFIALPELNITLVEPKHGYTADAPPIDVVFITTRESTCRWDNAGTERSYQFKKDFNQTGGMEHVLKEYDWNFPETHVECVDTYGYSTGDTFTLIFEPRPPQISVARANPEKVLDENNGKLETTLIVETTKSALCKYSDNETNYTLMEHTFNPFNTDERGMYREDHTALITDLIDQKDYKYYVACEGLSGLVSDTKSITFLTNLD